MNTMPTITPDLAELKSRMKSTWMAGDFGQIANFTALEAENFVGRLGIQAGAKVLDVACGTGKTAIPAAKTGASVTGVDIATNLLEHISDVHSAKGAFRVPAYAQRSGRFLPALLWTHTSDIFPVGPSWAGGHGRTAGIALDGTQYGERRNHRRRCGIS
jgi:SAM-dependent methyltransferase